MSLSDFDGIRTAPVARGELAYREQGDGEPVVFVHGAISDLRTWQYQLPVVGRSYRAVAYSRRYARPNEDLPLGESDPLDVHVEDLAAFLRQIDAVPAHLVGNSWGALISLLTAQRHPELVRSLVLEEPPTLPLLGLSAPPGGLEILRLAFREPAVAWTVLRFAQRRLPSTQRYLREGAVAEAIDMFGGGVLGEVAYRRLPEARRQQMRDNVSTLRALMEGAESPIDATPFRELATPTCIVTGEETPSFFSVLADHLAKVLPRSERCVIPAASHLMHEENPDGLNAELLSFLASQQSD